ncbi:HAD-IIA family hydrolase [Candidatus Micrarchaeota archaeon]|nr:HAD-IIA family hydrolase [Candidatus Micrarchaeota archaeon]
MIKAVVFDLDGTLYRGSQAIRGAPDALKKLRENGARVLFLTNAATRSRKDVAEKLCSMGIKAGKEEVYCSAYFLARYIREHYPDKTVFVVGERGMAEELAEVGIRHVERDAGIVAVGLDRQFTYEKLARAHEELGKGAILLASNKDSTFPTERGFMPGAGSIVASVETASGREAHVVGKPNCFGLEIIKQDHRLENKEILVVGDRIETDILFAKECGAKSVLVMSGVSKKKDIRNIVPDYVIESVAEFSLP